MVGLVLGWFCSGCGKNALEPATPVPIDCQRFLNKYFEAVKSKDVGKLQELSSYVSHVATRAKLAAASRARWAKRKGRITPAKMKGGITPAGRRRLSQLMKARWAARRRAAKKK
jgi:hypothetical protein